MPIDKLAIKHNWAKLKLYDYSQKVEKSSTVDSKHKDLSPFQLHELKR